MDVKVLGSGCPNCKRVEKVAREALAVLGVDAVITKVTDMGEILSYDITATPGLVINGDIVSYGRIPTLSETTTWIANALEKEA